MVGIEMSLKQALRTSLCPTAVAVFMSGNPVHMEEKS